MFVKTKTTGLVLDEKLYLDGITPPDSFEDRSRWGNNGTFGGGAQSPTWTQLPSGLWILSFDGNDYISIPHQASLSLTGNFGFELWLNPSNWNAGLNQPFLCKSNILNVMNYYVGETVGNALKFVHFFGGYWETIDTSGASWQNGVWYFIGVVVKEASNRVEFYRNGLLLSSVAQNFALRPILTNTLPFKIGHYLGGEYWTGGLISRIRNYNYAPSAAQNRKRFEATRHWFGV